jgi:predicted RNA methylase
VRRLRLTKALRARYNRGRFNPETGMTLLRALPCLFLLAALFAPAAATEHDGYQPELMQEGKDVVWLPSQATLVERMLDMARLAPSDLVIDLGSGDGITVIAAAKRGVQALGIEYDEKLVAFAKRNAEKEGVSDRARFARGDFFATDFSEATVLTLFIQRHLNLQLRPTILKMRPGTRVISNTFDMGDWIADEHAIVRGECRGYCEALLWIVPAQVQGSWRTEQGMLHLEQKYQMLSGMLTHGAAEQPVHGKLIGSEIVLFAGRSVLRGRVDGHSIEGTAHENGVGQEGKDVIWVPTPAGLVDKMLDMAKVTAKDYVIDLGSGDGRTVITAAKRGAKALGIEYNPDMVELSKRNAAKEGVADKASFVKADLFESDFSRPR